MLGKASWWWKCGARTSPDGLHGGDGLHCSRGAQQVANHGLGAVQAHVPAGQRGADRAVLRQVARLQGIWGTGHP